MKICKRSDELASRALGQSGDVTTPFTAANRRRKASLSPVLAFSRRRLPISALVVGIFLGPQGFPRFIQHGLQKLERFWGQWIHLTNQCVT